MSKLNTTRFRIWLIASAAVAGILLLVANSAIWTNRYLFNTQNFTNTATPALTSESSRDAIATEIVDDSLEQYPLVKSLVANTATNLISGFLDSGIANKVIQKSVAQLQTILTSSRREPIIINLEGIKNTLNTIISIAGNEQPAIDPNAIPSQIVLFNPDNLPNFYTVGVTLGWLSPLAIIAALLLLAWPYFKHYKQYLEIMATQGGIILLFGLFGLALGPLFKPTVLANVQSANLRVVVTNIYDAFVNTFNQQTMFMILLGVAAVLVSVGIYVFAYYRRKK